MLPVTVPSLLTCNQSHDYERYYQRGYRVMWFQHWNRGNRGPLDTGGDYNFDLCRVAGMDPGVWGVIYEDENSNRGNIARSFAERALFLGADHLMFDIEYNGFDAAPIIDGCRHAGWAGPVHLTCLGAPESNPSGGYWDYGYDLASFLATGGGIFPQAYWSPYPISGRHPNYAAEDCVSYYHEQLGVPLESLNMMIWPNGSNPAEDELARLEEGGLGKAMSIFLAESTSEHSYDVLEAITLGPDNETGGGGGGDNDTCEAMADMAVNVRLEQDQMTAVDPEKWIRDNCGGAGTIGGEVGEVLRLVVYTTFKKDWPAKELKSHAGRASSGIAQNGRRSMEL